MLALRWHAARDLRLDEVDEPGPPASGFVVVDVCYCGICGTDLAEYRDGPSLISLDPHPLTGQAPPITLGHEFSGRISAVAVDSSLTVGTRVTADACWRCFACDACLRGDYHLCRYGGSIGLHSHGAFATRVCVPEYTLVELIDGVSDMVAAMTEPLAVALHALERGGTAPGDEVVVLGFGPIGAATAICARAIGARPTVVERNAARQAEADSLGFATLEAGAELPRRARRALGSGGADVVIDSTGVAAVLPSAIECARRGGRVVLAGLAGTDTQMDARRLTLFERTLLGSLGYCRDLPKIVSMIGSGQIDPLPLIGEVIPLEAAPATIADMATRPDARIKILVKVGGDVQWTP